MAKINSHLHIKLKGFGIDEIINYMDSYKIDKCWLLTWEELDAIFKRTYINLSIDDVMDAYRRYPDRVVPFYAPDPGRDNWFEMLETYKKKGVKGCGELKVTYNWLDDEIKKVLDGVKKLEMPLVFHIEKERCHFFTDKKTVFHSYLYDIMNGAFNRSIRKYIEIFVNKTGIFKQSFEKRLWYFPGYLLDFAGLEKRLQEYPDVNFIAHGPEFWNNIDKNPDPTLTLEKGKVESKGIAVELLEKYDNLYVDTSGKSGFNALKRDPEFKEYFLNEFYHKILFGTDNEYKLPYENLISSAKISDKKLKMIMGENAESLCD